MDLTLAPSPLVEVPASTSAAISSLTVELLEDWPAVAALEAEWNELLRESSADSIFISWEWISCWADVVGSDLRPIVICVRDGGGALVGLAPLYRATLQLGRAIPYRVLRVTADFPTGADYPDWILRRGCEETALLAIVKALVAQRGWDCIWMAGMAGWTGSFDRILAACRARGLRCQTRPHEFSFFELPSDKETYFRSLSKNKRQQLRAEMKRTLLQPTVDICRCESEAQLPEFLDALFELHHRRWHEKGESGTFKERPQEAAFYRRFAPVALRRGWLRLFGLRDGAEFKAIQIGYVYRNVFHQLQEGFDPLYLKGVGNVLRAKTIEACIEEGIEAYDFLGDMSEHKRRWLGKVRTGYDLLIGRPTLKNLVLFSGVWPSCRFMRQISPLPCDAAPADDTRDLAV